MGVDVTFKLGVKIRILGDQSPSGSKGNLNRGLRQEDGLPETIRLFKRILIGVCVYIIAVQSVDQDQRSAGTDISRDISV